MKSQQEIQAKIKELEEELKTVKKQDRGGLAAGLLILKIKGLINALKWVIGEESTIII